VESFAFLWLETTSFIDLNNLGQVYASYYEKEVTNHQGDLNRSTTLPSNTSVVLWNDQEALQMQRGELLFPALVSFYASIFINTSCNGCQSNGLETPSSYASIFIIPFSQLNLSPLLALYGSLASYLLFSLILWDSVSGACFVGAGSTFPS
jgi:hypothetical protein